MRRVWILLSNKCLFLPWVVLYQNYGWCVFANMIPLGTDQSVAIYWNILITVHIACMAIVNYWRCFDLNVVQEKIMRIPYGAEKEFFRYSLFLVFCNRITTSMVSAMVLLVWIPLTDYLSNLSLSVRLLNSLWSCRQVRNHWTLWLHCTNMVLSLYQIYWRQPASMRLDLFRSFIYFVICVALCYLFTEFATWSFQALKYVSFPVQTLAKCAKMIPVMVISAIC